jgi:hypothetical protein
VTELKLVERLKVPVGHVRPHASSVAPSTSRSRRVAPRRDEPGARHRVPRAAAATRHRIPMNVNRARPVRLRTMIGGSACNLPRYSRQ